jgi:hypothetical protein
MEYQELTELDILMKTDEVSIDKVEWVICSEEEWSNFIGNPLKEFLSCHNGFYFRRQIKQVVIEVFQGRNCIGEVQMLAGFTTYDPYLDKHIQSYEGDNMTLYNYTSEYDFKNLLFSIKIARNDSIDLIENLHFDPEPLNHYSTQDGHVVIDHFKLEHL